MQRYGLTSQIQLYRGENAAVKFVDNLYDITRKVEELYKHIVPMINLTDHQTRSHNNATKFFLCDEEFSTNNCKVHDHDHLTGLYRGPACNNCNTQYKLPNFIPVVLHNLSCYDAHFIIPELGRNDGEIDVLATTSENFIKK